MATALENPSWSSLDSIHRDIVLREGEVARYPADHAPVIGVASARASLRPALYARVERHDAVYLPGIASPPPAGWMPRFRSSARIRTSRGAAMRGTQTFLRVSRDNPRAMDLSQRVGYRVRCDIGFWSLRRC
ncbi:hypothetical protein LJR168_001106 [Pseudoxanthomonas sp. LjRoot168]|uniref:hypothetical protein n=1 Tax=unclassified Pseudoxanthomonas TaxID=2645906 RepID=UPI003ECC3E16